MSKGSTALGTIVGRLGRDPKITTTKQGKTMAMFSVAVTTGWGTSENTMWVNVIVFNENLANRCADFLAKGSRVFVCGELGLNSWTNQTGEKTTDLQVTVGFSGSIEFLDSKTEREAHGGAAKSGANREDRTNPADTKPATGFGTSTWDDVQADDDVPY